MTACAVRCTAVAAALMLSTAANAGIAPYFDRTDFIANLSGPQADLDFDDQSAGAIGGGSLATTLAATGLPGVSVSFPATVPDLFGTQTIVPAIIASSADNPTPSGSGSGPDCGCRQPGSPSRLSQAAQRTRSVDISLLEYTYHCLP